MTAFDDALAEVPTRRNARRLRVDEVLDEFDEDSRQAALAALNNTGISIPRLVKAFGIMGHDVSVGAFRSWRARNGGL